MLVCILLFSAVPSLERVRQLDIAAVRALYLLCPRNIFHMTPQDNGPLTLPAHVGVSITMFATLYPDRTDGLALGEGTSKKEMSMISTYKGLRQQRLSI